MRGFVRWSTVEQLVLVESMENFQTLEQRFWESVSNCMISTLRMIGSVDPARFTERECYNEWENLKLEYQTKLPRDCDLAQGINYLLRKKRIEELDKEMTTIKSKLLRLQDMSSY